MNNLARLQADFLAAVVDAASAGKAPAIRGGSLDAEQRLAVYRRNLHANWRAALEDTHPVVARLVGSAFFGEAARLYATAHPSRSGDLNRFGEHFADFLAGYPHAKDVPYLADVARLEWAWHACFHAASAAPLDLAALGAVPAEHHGEIRFSLHPAARLVESAHPILALWAANQPERDGTPDRFQGPDRVLIHRPELEVEMHLLDAPDFAFLCAVREGRTFEAAAALAGFGDARALGSTLQRFVATRVLVAFAAP